MKHIRIQELLKPTGLLLGVEVKESADGESFEYTVPSYSPLATRAVENAARVQLLAKALKDIRQDFKLDYPSEFDDDFCRGYSAALKRCNTIALEALKEARMEG